MKSTIATLAVTAVTAVSAAAINCRSTPAKLAAAAASSARPTFFNNTCTAETLSIRKEWRNLAADEKAAYLAAENCLIGLPAQTSLSGVTNRFSDLQATHRDKTNATVDGVFVGDIIHSVVSEPTRSTDRSTTSYPDGDLLGAILPMAPLVHLRARADASQRVQLHRPHALVG